jgi:hypothetical protein
MAGMAGIGGIGRAAQSGTGRVTRGGGFRLPEAAREASGSPAVLGAAPLGLLAVQEADDAASRDRRGAARAQDLLKELSALQAGLLCGGTDPAGLERLARLAEGESPADPVLADALAGIALRARVELARHRFASGQE